MTDALEAEAREARRQADALALRMKDLGVTTVIYTDVSRDGMMQGPNVEATAALVQATGLDVIGSGGVSGVADLIRLRDAGCAGAILGKALYEGGSSGGPGLIRREKNGKDGFHHGYEQDQV